MKNVTSILALAALPLVAQEAPPADTTAPVAAPAPKMVVSDHPEAATSIGKEDLKQIPDSVGRAGMVAGAADGKILMTGGANFPDAKKGAKTAAERGAKKFYGDVHLCDLCNEPKFLLLCLRIYVGCFGMLHMSLMKVLLPFFPHYEVLR